MSEDCKHCIFNETEENCPGCWEGSHFKSKQPQKRIVTNADRIRAMSDEELAEVFVKNADCYGCEIKDFCYNSCNCECSKAWIEWLKQEAGT